MHRRHPDRMLSGVAKIFPRKFFSAFCTQLALFRSSSSLTHACNIVFSIKICIFMIGEIKYAFFISMPCKACMAKNAPMPLATIFANLRFLRIYSKYGANSSLVFRGVRSRNQNLGMSLSAKNRR